jgi:hypothetical protein
MKRATNYDWHPETAARLGVMGGRHRPSGAGICSRTRRPDYYMIQSNKTDQRLTPEETRTWHFHSLLKLKEFLKEGDPARSIVVTHHAPSARSIPGRYKNDALTPAFVSNLDGIILDYQPLLWIHGHIHDSFDYQIGKTRIICNPRGYAPIFNPGFIPDLIVD